MSAKQTVTINGRQYDAHSGLAIDIANVANTTNPQPRRATTSAQAVHAHTQRSHTLNRKALKRPAAASTPQPGTPIILRKTPRQHPAASTQKHTAVTRFAPHPMTTAGKRVMDIGPVPHPHVVKAHALSQAKAEAPRRAAAPKKQLTAQDLQRTAVHHAVEAAHSTHAEHPKPRFLQRHPRAISIVSASIALVLLGGYLTYLNMPSLSVRVAAAQAGINATYPNYQPDGYSLHGAVSYAAGKVTMRFASNGGPTGFTVNQSKSNWDSAAVLDNYVTPRTGASYVPYTEHGLTIYTFGNNAAWVNGGILYTIEGNAPLSSEQIRRIATSLI